MPPLMISVGGFGVSLSGSASFLRQLRHKYSPFVNDSQRPHLDIQLLEHNYPSSDEPIDVEMVDGCYIIHGGEFRGQVNLTQRTAVGEMRFESSVFDSFLRVVYSIIMSREKAALIHAAGLSHEAQGYLFVGPSESGKSTTASLAGEMNVLNDELVLLKRGEDGFVIAGTPFHGDFSGLTNTSARLKNIFFLDKTLKEPWRELTAIDTMTKLMEQVFFFNPDLASNQRILDLCHDLSQQFQGYSVNVKARSSIKELIDELNTTHCHS